MTYKMADLRGIDQNHVTRLREAGVENTDEMMQTWNDQAKRLELVTKTTFTDDELSRLAAMARVARMKGIGPKYAGLLVTAGVRGRKSLATFTPETLVRHLGDVNAAKSLAAPVPTLAETEVWFAELDAAVRPSSS